MRKSYSRREAPPAESSAPVLPVIQAAPDLGLTAAQAAERAEAGLDNRAADSPTKTEQQIIKEHVFTFFNLVFVVLALCLALVGSWHNMTFLGIVVCNTVIGIYQELRAKRTVDKLTLVSQRKVRCVRDGKVTELPSSALVRDDIVEFSAGDQICADAVLRTGQLQANEALITGEADPITKDPGDTLRSGSFVVSGHCRAQLTHVGAQSYANRLTTEAKSGVKVEKGEMMRSLDGLIRVIGVMLVPMGIVLFLNQYDILKMSLQDSVVSTVAALIGMIPEGLYLLTSVALAVSMMRLAQRKVLAQDMNCIETLARVDVLCVDKTGTITEQKMSVRDMILLDEQNWPRERTEEVLRAFYGDSEPDNDTARALVERFGGTSPWRCTGTVPFDSAYKWSAAGFAGHGSFVVGAPEFVLGARYGEYAARVEPCLSKGYRVLVAAGYNGTPDPKSGLDPAALHPIALILLANRIRPEAPKTFRYFAQQGVAVKVISGDNPMAVSEVARRAGIANAGSYVDASTLRTDEDIARSAQEYTVFGRVTPAQKRKLVKALQAQGHTVAMTGDGVNDVLALKDADCGIAMASGAQAAAQVAQLVLLDSNFAGLPAVVAEGRRVINNIERSASLYLVKNIFSFALSLISLFVTMPYPLQPIQLTLISAVTIGIPSFFLALEPNHERVQGKFLWNVLRAALPGALTNLGLILGVEAFVYAFEFPLEMLYTISTLVVLTVNLIVLFLVCKPFTVFHGILWGGMLAAACVAVAALGPLFGLAPLNLQGALVLAVFMLLALPLMRFVLDLFERGGRLLAKLTHAGAKAEPENI
ncbi:MAG: HAD-IC family P-type ATPase [Gemmiger sp.]